MEGNEQEEDEEGRGHPVLHKRAVREFQWSLYVSLLHIRAKCIKYEL